MAGEIQGSAGVSAARAKQLADPKYALPAGTKPNSMSYTTGRLDVPKMQADTLIRTRRALGTDGLSFSEAATRAAQGGADWGNEQRGGKNLYGGHENLYNGSKTLDYWGNGNDKLDWGIMTKPSARAGFSRLIPTVNRSTTKPLTGIKSCRIKPP